MPRIFWVRGASAKACFQGKRNGHTACLAEPMREHRTWTAHAQPASTHPPGSAPESISMLARRRDQEGRGAWRALAVGAAVVVLGCARKDQNARGSSPAGEVSSEATRAALDLAAATPETPLRPEEPARLLSVHN